MKMILFSSKTSPFARKVRIAIEELQLTGLVEERFTDYTQPSAEFLQANPLAQIPALSTEKGETLPGSDLILEYLQSRGRGLASLPRGSQRFAALRRLNLADGAIEAAVAVLLESRRPDGERSAAWMARKRLAVTRAIVALEAEVSSLVATEAPSIVEVTVGALLGYLDFRFADLAWRDAAPGLSAWYAEFVQRPSMQNTQPVG